MFPGIAAPTSPRVTDETVSLVQQAMERRGITTATGFTGYELEAPAKIIVPVITPLVNMIPRRMGNGVDIVHWKAVTSFDTARNPGVLLNNGLPQGVSYNVVPMQNVQATIALSDSVDFEAQWTGRSLEGDVRARRVAELLYQLKMVEERWILNASQYLMAPPAPVLSAAATGGTVAANTYWVGVTAINANGESTIGNFASVTTTGATSVITITIFTVWNATGYNVYVGSGASKPANNAMWLQSGISGNSNAPQPAYNANAVLVSGGSVPTGEIFGPTVVVTISAPPATSGTNPPSSNTAKTYVDGSGNIKMWDGLLAQAISSAGGSNGQTLTAQVGQPAAANGVLALSDVDNLLVAAYSGAAGDPDFLVMHPITHRKLTNLVIASGQSRFVIEANEPQTQGQLVAQYRVTHYMNPSTGKMMPIIPDRYCPVDTILALPMTIPYPVPEIANAVEIETNREYWGVDFAITGSNYPFADYVMETLKLYFLGGTCVLRGINPSA